ncbi:MAG: hypothetical protein DRJ42_14945 [Deltaproteobacteria bacterium]|nr:MAG: hypothetical protein DRJ42_14945 [Deltaproteobacteria bacterium]
MMVALLGFSLGACGDDGPRPGDGSVGDGGDATLPPQPDADGDGISDNDEGRVTNRDTDGDDIPDYLDTDSDGDSISDADEAGDSDTNTPPEDADMDGVPNFVDDDSDGNGISDLVEGVMDADGDGIPNYRDLDDDNDRVDDSTEIVDPSVPVDFDGDGLADFRDPDSDGDFILDGDERPRAGEAPDTDGDGTPDWRDDDSDGDGISDADEAGDMDIRTPPLDTDMDSIPNFRDTDSDNDGVSDADELAAGSDPTLEDTDGDGITDLIEIAGGTDPTDAFDNPRERGDFVFVVAYEEAPDPLRDTLEFRTSIQFADIYFLMDESGSMSSESSALRSAVTTIISNLTCMDFGTPCTRDEMCGTDQVCALSGTCIEDPSISSCVASPWTGAGQYENTLMHDLDLQPDPAVTTATMSAWTFPGGTEHLFQAAQCSADPTASGCAAYMDPGHTCATPAPDRVGCPGFRAEAVKILVMFTDEDSDGPAVGTEAGMALADAGITFIGVWSGTAGSTARGDLVTVATGSGSLDSGGSPLVFDGNGAGVVPVVTAAINEIVEGVPLRVTIDAADQPGDAGDSLQFIRQLETNTMGGTCSMIPTEDSDMDGVQDTFPTVTPGTPVCYDIVAESNTMVPPEASPLVFEALVTVYGDGSPLDSRRVFFLVPPVIPGSGGPD